jgi:hypothetical protein
MLKTGALDQLQQVHELNRAFLGLLQSRLRQRRSCLGLPVAAQPAVAAAGNSSLEAVASFPRALFHVRLGSLEWPVRADAQEAFDEQEQALSFSILFAVRQTSRHSRYHARLLFGLESIEVERLCASALTDMQRLACAPGVLTCAFGERHWFWPQLFTATRPELRRGLTLIALQPSLDSGWPQRRPPQPTA